MTVDLIRTVEVFDGDGVDLLRLRKTYPAAADRLLLVVKMMQEVNIPEAAEHAAKILAALADGNVGQVCITLWHAGRAIDKQIRALAVPTTLSRIHRLRTEYMLAEYAWQGILQHEVREKP